MGLLSTGTSLTWEEIEQLAEYIKQHGIIQFINTYTSLKNRQHDLLKYGDEIEYMIVYFDHENKCVKLGLQANEALDHLQREEREGFM